MYIYIYLCFLYQTINIVFNGGMLGAPWGLSCLWQVLNIVASYFKNSAVLFFWWGLFSNSDVQHVLQAAQLDIL